ncbi:hypothetical protein AADZ86_01950 [Colwelliaceae bacterium BS250]
MADESSKQDNLTEDSHILNNSVVVPAADNVTGEEEHSSLWWLNMRRRSHKHITIKRNQIRRKH